MGSDQEGPDLKLLVPAYHTPGLWAGHSTAPPLLLSRCQRLWVDASSQYLAQGDILAVALSPAPSHSLRRKQDNRKRLIFPKLVCLQGRQLQLRLPLVLSRLSPEERHWRSWGLVSPFLKGTDKTNCTPVTPVSLYWLRADQTQVPITALRILWILLLIPLKSMDVCPQWSHHHTAPCESIPTLQAAGELQESL